MSLPRLLVLLALAALLAVYGGSRIRYAVDPLDMLPAELPEVEGMRGLYRHFVRENELILTLEFPGDTAPEAASAAAGELARTLRTRPDLSRSVMWRLPFEENPEAGAEMLAWLWLNGPPGALADLTARLSPDRSRERLADAIETLASGFLDAETMILSYDPLGLTALPGGLETAAGASGDLFASPDGRFRVLYLEAPDGASFSGYRETAAWVAAVRAAAESWRAGLAAETRPAIGLTGEPAFVAEISTTMERDLKGSVATTAILIALLFWLMHRRLKPLVWLMAMLAFVFAATFAAGGLIFGELSAMSIGFAAILLGLVVDYGVVLYREGLAERAADARAVRRIAGPGIVWAAVTTAAVFLALNLSSLPAIAQLGSLVAVGVGIGMATMLGLFAPAVAAESVSPSTLPESAGKPGGENGRDRLARIVTAGVAAVAAGVLAILGPPSIDTGARPFDLRNGRASAALTGLETRLGTPGEGERLPLVVTAQSPGALAKRLADTDARLAALEGEGLLKSRVLPLALAPSAANQTRNAAVLARLSDEGPRLRAEVLESGFTEEAAALGDHVLAEAAKLAAAFLEKGGENEKRFVLPRSDLGRWLIGRAVSEAGQEWAAIGQIEPVSGALAFDAGGRLAWRDRVDADGVRVTGWPVLNPAIQGLIRGDFVRVFLPMGLVLIVVLAAVFRSGRDLALCLGSLAFSGLVLLALTRVLPVRWDFFNLASVPILFGTGLDYGIHMIFALRRTGGDREAIRRGIGGALRFCGLSTTIGFGTLAFAGASGLAGLGLLCALGIFLNMATAVWLLPPWRGGSAKRRSPH
ncbi:MAG: MMPL family transporter [Verrucomicrobiae bacterium]|nr:MMPL family transporter [Verrucomicrobiae bacterium]